ncbi:unnamed protein product [Rotaria sp. Silwood1]|nr:unnamed protein product [Rotaria sp. Silwood1]
MEKLDLYLIVYGRKILVNSNELKSNIMKRMPRLNKFTFNINSNIRLYNQIDLLLNEDIQHTFEEFKDNQIVSCVNYFPKIQEDGLFKYVYEISLSDEHPFEHKFFLRIAQSLPLLEKLTLINEKPQINKLCNESNNDNQDLSIIKYSHLAELSFQ